MEIFKNLFNINDFVGDIQNQQHEKDQVSWKNQKTSFQPYSLGENWYIITKTTHNNDDMADGQQT